MSGIRRRITKAGPISQEVLDHPPPIIDEEPKPPVTDKEDIVSDSNYWKPLYKPVLNCLSLIIAFLIYGSLLYVLLSGAKILVPGCPSVNGRVCNEQGVCTNGVCECFPLFSGPDCLQNQIPGYDIANNQQCSGNGFVLTYNETYIPQECRETRVSGVRTGGWNAQFCVNLINLLRSQIAQQGGDISKVPRGYQVPSCVCEPNYSGFDCGIFDQVCPRDENLRVCGGHGNTSVGIKANYTNAGQGCQCNNLFGFYQPQYIAYWTPEFYDFLNRRYNYEMNQIYCGEVKRVLNITSGQPIQNYVVAYTLASNYRCYCDKVSRGEVCTEGRCPLSPVTNIPCSGNGHPLYGQGYIEGSPVDKVDGVFCDIECVDGFEACGKKCFPKNNTIEGVSPFVYNAAFCNNPTVCPRSAPVRCADGSCAPIPNSFIKNCNLGFQYGSIDYGRLDVSIEEYRCPNITELYLYDICFKNSTVDNNVVGFPQTLAGGVVVNFTDPFYKFRVNFTSPLIYFGFTTNLSGVYIENFNGDIQFFNNLTVTGLLDYDLSLRWGQKIDYVMSSSTEDNLYYTFTPAPFNYTYLAPLGAFDLFRVTNILQRKVFALSTVTTFLNYEPIVDFLDIPNGVLVLYNTSTSNTTSLAQLYWISPLTGGLITNEVCLSDPAPNSWYVDIEGQSVRSLGGDNFICVDVLTGLPVVQDTQCVYDLSELLNLLPGVFFRWDTSIYALAQTQEVFFIDAIDYYQLPTNEDIPYYIDIYYQLSVSQQDSDDPDPVYVLMSDFIFLTKNDGIGFPCACDIPSSFTNQTVLNELWYLDTNTRSVTQTKIGNFILYPSFVTGDRVLRRGIVGGFNDESQTITVSKDNVTETVYFKEVRSISSYEYISGTPDGEGEDFLLNPFKCPSGKYTDAVLNVEAYDTSCNCTFTSPGLVGSDIFTNCTCVNEFTIDSNFACECFTGNCICGFPANTEFSNLLGETLASIETSGCQCLVYNGYQAGVKPSTGSLETSEYFQRVDFLGEFSYTFYFYPENIMEYLVVEFPACDGTETFTLLGGSSYFKSSEYLNVLYETRNNGSSTGNWVQGCQYYLNLIYDPALVFTNITVIADSIYPMSNVTLSFMKYGFSLMELQESKGVSVVVTASSNQGDASNVLWLGSEGWVSSGSLHEIPVSLEFSFTFNSYLTNYLLIFRSAGRKSGTVVLPLRVYLQGSIDKVSWYNMDSFQIYIDPTWNANPYSDERYQIHRYVPVLNQTYAYYRFISTSFIMDVLYVDLFTNVTCNCVWQVPDIPNPMGASNFGLALQLQGLEGLINITAQTERYYLLLENFKTFQGCVYTNNCTLMDENANYNGICNDVIYQASLLGILEDNVEEINVYYSPNNASTATEGFTYEGYVETSQVGDLDIGSVQFYVSPLDVLDDAAQLLYFQSTGGAIPLFNESSGLYIYYINTTTSLIQGLGDSTNIWTWVEGTLNVLYTQVFTLYGNLIASGAACEAGTDGDDCGNSVRKRVLSPGESCNPTNPFDSYNAAFGQSANLYYRSLLVSNLKSIISPWYGEILRLRFDMNRVSIHPLFCGGDICPIETPFKCLNGRCVKRKQDCFNTYTCPGNGCVQLTNSSDFGAYRCACRPGASGEDCSYEDCRPATPDVPITQPRVPPAEECMCGGPPPLRIKPPVLNKKAFYTTEELKVINRAPKGSCAPRSKEDTGLICIGYSFAPFGQVVLREAKILLSPLLPNTYQKILTTCGYYRKGYYGEPLTRDDDVAYENVFTGKPVWKTYTNPFTGAKQQFVWTDPFSYDDLPYRCPNGHCVANRDECSLSEAQFPLCNDRGKCMSDGSCKCSAAFKTFLINEEFSATIRYPYEWDNRKNTTNPVAWVPNLNWRLYALNQCAARDCSYGKCTVPRGCKTGTYELGFTDKEILCPNNGLCAKNIYACYGNVNLTSPGDCSFNGIKRIKDVTGEEYCACGSPKSSLINIQDITNVADLEPNGWGGPFCNQYFANQNVPLLWSPWDYKNNAPYRDSTTGQVLPGVWVKGDIIVGPRPEDKALWDKCCQGYASYKLCPFVPCNTPPTISCLSQQACLVYDPTAPLVYDCNGHGVARADGTCLCDYNEEEGYVYVPDVTVTDDGCYSYKDCQKSRLTGIACDTPSQCEDPSVWQYPFEPIPFIDDQWLMASRIKGPYNNQTLLQLLDINQDNFNERVQEALGRKAQDVQRAIASYNGCVCYFNGDNSTNRQGMVVNGKDYVYMQAFTSPYLLPVTPDNTSYSKIFDGYVYPVGRSLLNTLITTGTVINVTFPQQYVVISALRIMASPGLTSTNPVVVFYDSAGNQICPTVTLQSYDIDYNYPVFNWNGGPASGSTLGRALSCGPVYTCVAGKTFPDYDNLCGVKTDTDQCISYRESSCLDAGYEYWPVDSLDQYPGCDRVADEDTCVCCRRVTPLQLITDGKLSMRVLSGSAYLVKTRFYGYSNSSLVSTPEFRSYVSEGLGYVTECQDQKFYIGRLGSDKSYYTFPSTSPTSKGTYSKALEICSLRGSWMAIGVSSISNTQSNLADTSLDILKRECGNIGNGNGICWVNARSLLNDLDVPRRPLFDPQCDLWGCFFSNLFYSNNSAYNYSTSYYQYIGNTQYKQYPAADYVTDIGPAAPYAFPGMDYYASSYCITPTNCKLVSQAEEKYTILAITYKNGYKITIRVGHNLQAARTYNPWTNEGNATAAYGSFMSYFQFFPSYSMPGVKPTWENTAVASISVSGTASMRFQRAADPIQCVYQPAGKDKNTINGYGPSDSLDKARNLIQWLYEFSGLKYGNKFVYNLLDYGNSALLSYISGYCTMNSILMNLAFEGRDISYANCIKSSKCPALLTCEYDYPAAGSDIYSQCCYRYYAGYALVATREFCIQAFYSFQSFKNEYCTTTFPWNAYNKLRNQASYLAQPSSNTIDIHPGCSYNLVQGTVVCAGGTSQPINNGDFTPIQNIVTKDNCFIPVMSVLDSGKNYPTLSSYMTSEVKSLVNNFGSLNTDLTYGYTSRPYMPLFVQGRALEYTLLQRPPSNVYFYNLMQYRSPQGDLLPPLYTRPVYILQPRWYGMLEGVGWNSASNVLPCSSCYYKKSNLCYWDQMYYSQVVWQNQFNCPVPEIYVVYPLTGSGAAQLPTTRTPLTVFAQAGYINAASFYVHQLLYIQNYTFNSNPVVKWFLPSCLAVNSTGSVIRFCDTDVFNVICQYDWTKYAVVTGTQCDGPTPGKGCGCSTRTGGFPIPGLTCGLDNPLANATLYPYDHLILRNYQLGTLGDFARTFDIAPDVFDFQNVSVIMGVPGAWEKWAGCYCDRPGFTPFGEVSSLNWVCLCLNTIWPVDCGRQIDPRTNVVKRFCAAREEYCNVYLNDSEISGPPMRVQDIPPLLLPVDQDLAKIDPTCGYNVQLSSYVQIDRFGGPQTTLNLDEKLIDINSQFIQIQTTTRPAIWFNGGKAVIDFKFEWNIPVSITLYYKLELCSTCTNAIMEVFIHPINLDYSEPEVYLSYNVSMVNDVLTLVTVEFTVDIADTGFYVVEGETFALRVFKGIGFKFHNIDAGSLITLYNPVVSTPSTRTECTTRQVPQWREAPLRVNSRAPNRFCPVRKNQVNLYPGAVLGECYCGSGRGGPGCDCIATKTPYGEEVCGGDGDAGKLIIGPDNVYYSTGVGVEAGCYIYTSPSGKKFSDCKNVNKGTYIFTLFTPGATFDYPSVYVDFVPAKDVPIFRYYEDNTDQLNYTQAVTACASVGMYMPYYQTIDDLNQLLIDTRGKLPIFMGVDTLLSTPTSWPWQKSNVGYFLLDPLVEYASEEGTCTTFTCPVVNFNNYAYLATVTPASASGIALHDGNTLTQSISNGNYDFVWAAGSELVVTFVLFGDLSGSDTVSCTGGICDPFTSNGVVKTADCRCPGRFATVHIANNNHINEVQIFNAIDTIRSTSYTYF